MQKIFMVLLLSVGIAHAMNHQKPKLIIRQIVKEHGIAIAFLAAHSYSMVPKKQLNTISVPLLEEPTLVVSSQPSKKTPMITMLANKLNYESPKKQLIQIQENNVSLQESNDVNASVNMAQFLKPLTDDEIMVNAIKPALNNLLGTLLSETKNR